jgi:hypothetical protein
MRAMFAWRYLDHEGQEVGSSERFADKEGAESWIGLTWADLHANGIEEVVLVDEDRGDALYRMGLAQEGAEP